MSEGLPNKIARRVYVRRLVGKQRNTVANFREHEILCMDRSEFLSS